MIYIDTKSTSIYYNLAAEYYFATEKNTLLDTSDGIFMLWKTSPTLIIGRFQNLFEEIDLTYARERGITVSRRLSGGGTIYSDENNLMFTFIARGTDGQIDFVRYVRPITDALNALGVPAELSGRNDIIIGGRKISGNAQYRAGGCVIHHGTLLLDSNIDELVRATTPQDYKIISKAIQSVRDRVTNLSEHLAEPISPEEMQRYLSVRITDAVYEITPEDDRCIRAIEEERFRNPNVIYASTPKFAMEKTLHLTGGTFVIGLSVRDGTIADCAISGDYFSASAEDLGTSLIGVPFTPDAVRDALAQFEGKIFGAQVEELVRGIFE